MRVWDVLFNEGAKVLFHVALAIFKVIATFLLHNSIFAAPNLNFISLMLSLKITKNEGKFPMESFLKPSGEQIINL